MNFQSDMPNCFAGHIDEKKRSIIISAPAKINLFLKVTGKRPDGYHSIYSWFQALDLADHLSITVMPEKEIEITTDYPGLPTDEKNLIYQAARLLQIERNLDYGFKIRLSKHIPVAAGLGGGSSDAAATILGINKLLGLQLSYPEMTKIGLKIGSDVPFFFSCGQAEVTGRGEIVKNIELPVNYTVALATPPLAIRAAEAYQRLKLDLTEQIDSINFTCCRKAAELFDVISDVANDLERALRVTYPVLDEIREMFAHTRAKIVRLSGSGPTVFALYNKKALWEEEFASSFVGKGWDWHVASPVVLPHKVC